MLPSEGEFFEVDLTVVLAWYLHDELVSVYICALFHFTLLGERQLLGSYHNLVEMADGDFVIIVEDEAVLRGKILHKAEFSLDVVLHLVFIAVEMVRRNVGDYGDVRLELVAVVQLEAADFQNVIVMVGGGNLVGVALLDIPA